jgi:hypothetical protein
MTKGLIAGIIVVGGIGALVAHQAPDIRRYMKISRM